jgi:hypothetical protein
MVGHTDRDQAAIANHRETFRMLDIEVPTIRN